MDRLIRFAQSPENFNRVAFWMLGPIGVMWAIAVIWILTIMIDR